MITLARNLRLDRESQSHARPGMDLCGPYACEHIESEHVRCNLRIAGTNVAVDLPAETLARHRQSGAQDEVVLQIPGEEFVPVETLPHLGRKQRRQAARWIAEMENFDRF
jgi:hypothetical protein